MGRQGPRELGVVQIRHRSSSIHSLRVERECMEARFIQGDERGRVRIPLTCDRCMVHVPCNTGKGLVQSSRTSDAKPHLPERAQIRWGVYGRTPCPRPVVWFDSTKPDRLRRGDEPVSPASLGPQSGNQGDGVVTVEARPKLAAPSDGRGRAVTSRDRRSLSENFGRKPIPAGASPVSLGRDSGKGEHGFGH